MNRLPLSHREPHLPPPFSPCDQPGTAFLLFRLYANDVDITSTDPKLADWGWKQPPTISYKSSQGCVHRRVGENM